MSRKDVLITADELKSRLGEVILLDVAPEDSDRRIGIQGAVRVSPLAFAGEGGGTRGNRPLPDLAALQADVRRWGIHDESEIVLYDSKGNQQAARGWWTLIWAGLSKVRLLDGAFPAAELAGLPVEVLENEDRPGTATLSGGHLPVLDADAAGVLAQEGRLIDARPSKAFNGDPAAKTGGHIAGSVNLPGAGNLDDSGRFLDDDTLRRRFSGLLTKAPGVTCGSGISAAHNAAALAILGITAPLFVGSWSAWSADPSRPVAYGATVEA